MKPVLLRFISLLLVTVASSSNFTWAQLDRNNYIKHYSGYFLSEGSNGKAQLRKEENTVKYYMTKAYRGYYYIIIETENGRKYLNLSGDRDLVFSSDNSTQNSHFAIEANEGGYSLIKCRANGKYIGTDDNRLNAMIYCDKDGKSSRHLWFLSDDSKNEPSPIIEEYLLNPDAVRQIHEGWGVSLAWWANMCGKWSNSKIDQIVDWLVSPSGLNYNVFRYNIGGGDDPNYANCDSHHMASGKGSRAEMEGFKNSSDGDYIWTRDAAQRKIMLKIKEKLPDAIFEAFSNSAPYYMTYSGCVAGNTNAWKDNLRPEYYEEFAHYLVDVCKHYKEVYGIEFRTLEPFNEPATDYWGANGGQEGCHWDYNSQVAFVKVLYPILQASGLKTVIAASDECWVDAAITGFNTFKDAGILDMVGQWNTHTYNANNLNRSRLNALVHDSGKRLWMSETGAAGDGIKGNLDMTHRLFDDIRYLECESWVDWQYIEEWNDQWCMVKANFSAQTYEKVKNYFVRQQVTKFIKPGYRFVATPHEHTLAAINESRDTLVLVAFNADKVRRSHNCHLMGCNLSGNPYGFITTSSANLAKAQCKVTDDCLSFSLPDLSIATFIIPLAASQEIKPEIQDGDYYLIQPQYNRHLALTAKDNNVIVDNVKYNDCLPQMNDAQPFSPVADNQTWQLVADGDGYRLINKLGHTIYGNAGYYLTVTDNDMPEDQNPRFSLQRINDYSYKIVMTGSDRAFDLENKKAEAGTNVGLWEYGSNPSECHRNWQLTRIKLSNPPASINTAKQLPVNINIGHNLLEISCADDIRCNACVYALNGQSIANVVFDRTTTIPLPAGYCIIYISSPSGYFTRTLLIN